LFRPSLDHLAESIDALITATLDPSVRRIVVRGQLKNAPTIRLAPGQSLNREGAPASIEFADGVDGLQLSTDNEVSGMQRTRARIPTGRLALASMSCREHSRCGTCSRTSAG
jgi:hypothetical protein